MKIVELCRDLPRIELFAREKVRTGIAWKMRLMAGISEMRLKNYFGSSFFLLKTRTGG